MTPQLTRDLNRSREFVETDAARRFIKRATYRRINGRRCDLIHRDCFDGDLTAGESAELEILQTEVGRVTSVAWPMTPVLDKLERELAKIEAAKKKKKD